MAQRLHKKDEMSRLKSMDDNALEKEYQRINLVISKLLGQKNRPGVTLEKDDHREYKQTITMRARVLTIMNQRRHQRTWMKD